MPPSVNPCTDNPCKNGGTCKVTGDDSYSCQCAEGYYGDNCEKVSPCKSGPCKNGGSCTMTGPDSYSCNCTDEFEGPTCEKRLPCPPGKKTDDAQGRCCVFPFTYGGKSYNACTTAGHNRLWCSFDAVYIGRWANCVDECAPSPCKNGANCTETREGYSCQPCPPGWQGNDCDEDIDECNSAPCKNGGTCVNKPGTYTCTCEAGFKGKHCEEVYWKPEGCFKEKKKSLKKLLKKDFKRVKGITKNPDIAKIFETCKAAAEKAGYDIFAIKKKKYCVTSESGKLVNFKKYGVSSQCYTDDEGHGIGKNNFAIFVYTRET